MLNLKKGLALVLAAATAFTFAPVANLGQAVSVYAATGETTRANWHMSSKDFKNSDGSFATASNKEGVSYSNDTSYVTYADYDGIVYLRPITVTQGNTYKIDSQNNIEVIGLSNTNAYSNKTKDDGKTYFTANVAGEAAGAEVKIYATFKVKSVNGGSFVLGDDKSDHGYTQIACSIDNPSNYSGAKGAITAKVYNTSGDGNTEAERQNAGTTNNYYQLQLNAKTSNYYIKVDGVAAGSFQTWTGVAGTEIKDNAVYATDASGNLVWDNKSAVTGGVTLKLSDADQNTKNAFHVTSTSSGIRTITLSLDAKFDGASGYKTVSTDINYIVDRSDNAIDWIRWGKKDLNLTTSVVAGEPAATVGTDTITVAPQSLNQRVNNTVNITVHSESQSIQFVSSDYTMVDVKQDAAKPYKATVTAKSSGTATINVYVNGTTNNRGKIVSIPVSVPVNDTDQIKVEDSRKIYSLEADNTIYLDAADQTAANAVKDDVLTLTSAGKLDIINVKSSDTSVVTVNKTAAGYELKSVATNVSKTTPKVAYITYESKGDVLNKHVFGSGTQTLTVLVWGKPANSFNVPDVYLTLDPAHPQDQIKTLQTDPVKTNVSWTKVNDDASSTDLTDGTDVFDLTNPTGSSNSQTSSTVIARTFGHGTVKALVTETAEYRPTAKKFTVYVDAAKSNVITPSATSLVINEGEQANLTATSSASKTVSFTSADPSVATVATAGGIVAAVKPGQTSITIKSEGATDVVVPVIVTAKQTTAVPAAVTGVKVANKKGAKVTVTWTSQDKNINYRVYKKVGNGSWKAKNVAGNKTTLSVKKGAKVTVKVKAYVKDANGKTTWGPKATQKSLKTDKK